MKREVFDKNRIPKELWLHPKLSWEAKFLWAEIQSQYCEERGGCSQPDSYLMKFIDVKLSQFQGILRELKDAGLVVGISHGRIGRVLKAIDPNEAIPFNKENLAQAN